jgi:hypothetical protein
MGTTRRDSQHEPIREDYSVDTPFRDGVHIRRDAHILGLPAFAIYGERCTQLEPIDWQPRGANNL